MEYQKNIATNVYHGFLSLLFLVTLQCDLFMLKMKLVEPSVIGILITILVGIGLAYNLFKMKVPN